MIAFLLCGDIMLFPWALRSGWLMFWILSIIILVISGTLWPKVQNADKEYMDLASEKNTYPENHYIEDIALQIQVNTDETVAAASQEGQANLQENPRLIPIAELIDLGFKEKNVENYEQAASIFFRALSLDPMPDLAFYLIIDCYWLWNNLGERDYALTQLQAYVQKYLPQFNTQLRYQFEAWMTKEDLHKMFE
ncbi:conserved hypothetical protein [Candidatus Desulfosporosinus infrequens]|uniref:Tetratricopeptide repeat protein n=1 Tax=Candidatus Desulfosporosinus infrequens TaxID=2043169 RepID=A0A2U3LY18_9FIRM|nr:conserved hypothetical protein [Candidatus Desulfosporosinus infrequens]